MDSVSNLLSSTISICVWLLFDYYSTLFPFNGKLPRDLWKACFPLPFHFLSAFFRGIISAYFKCKNTSGRLVLISTSIPFSKLLVEFLECFVTSIVVWTIGRTIGTELDIPGPDRTIHISIAFRCGFMKMCLALLVEIETKISLVGGSCDTFCNSTHIRFHDALGSVIEVQIDSLIQSLICLEAQLWHLFRYYSHWMTLDGDDKTFHCKDAKDKPVNKRCRKK